MTSAGLTVTDGSGIRTAQDASSDTGDTSDTRDTMEPITSNTYIGRVVTDHQAADRTTWPVRSARRYLAWERRTAERLSKWPVARRWITVVLVPAVLLCGCGSIVGAPLSWLIGTTIQASRGAPSPDAAVNTYLMALGYDNDAGLLPVLDDQGGALMAQWNAYRADMRRGAAAPSKLEIASISATRTDGRRAVVEAEVYPVWWAKTGGATSVHGETHPWRFTTRENNGWQIDSVTPYPWCGGYVPADTCG